MAAKVLINRLLNHSPPTLLTCLSEYLENGLQLLNKPPSF